MAGKKPVRSAQVKLTDDVWESVLCAIEDGFTIRQIADMDGMPSWDTIRRAMRGDPEKSSQYAHAREKSSEAFEAELLEAARTAGPEDAAAKRLHVDALKWVMSKRSPKVYGDKITQEHTGPGGKDLPTPTLVISTYQKPDDTDTD
ncbi:hypothetical protein [Acetobacter sp. UBA5411]|uniref:terminase small subunit-like protein n=1 Tax=Acetobacter sp. UBA5411 TaxID=1945905 RepID=UPI0025C66E61|nr:hypothetical protein [Acetobacter sp. UBA5411]